MIPRSTPRQPTPDAVALQWANGKTTARAVGSSDRFTALVGWHIEAGRDAELDAAAERIGLAGIEIKHQRPGGAEIVRHWSLGESLLFLPITAGPPATTVAACLSNGLAKATADAGLGLRWERGERSKLAVRGFARVLWEAGYKRPLQLGVRSRMTEFLLATLLDHVRVAEAADALVDRARHPAVVSLAELWLPLLPGSEVELGRGDTATVTPIVSGHPATVDAEYLRTIWAGQGPAQQACGHWEATQRWAAEYQIGPEVEPGEPDAVAGAAAVDPAAGELFEMPPTRRQSADEVMASGGTASRRRRPVP